MESKHIFLNFLTRSSNHMEFKKKFTFSNFLTIKINNNVKCYYTN